MSERLYSQMRSNQGPAEGAGTRQCRGNPQQTAGGRGRETDPSGPVRAQ